MRLSWVLRYSQLIIKTIVARLNSPRSRRIFSFHRPETLAGWLKEVDTLRRRSAQMQFANSLAGAKRVLFLVDRSNLGKQAATELDQFVTPETNRKFTELYGMQHLQSNKLDEVSHVISSK